MDSGRWLFQQGLEATGYLSAGGGLPSPGIDCTDVAELIRRHNPPVVLFWPRYEWDAQEWGPGPEVTEADRFYNWGALLDRPDILRVCVLHDAGSARARQRAWHQAISPHVYLTWYHPQAVTALCPHVAETACLRTYHVVDRDALPKTAVLGDRPGRIVLSGAHVRDIYPLRTRAVEAARRGELGVGVKVLRHPGYHQNGTTSTDFLLELTGHRVALCTASAYRFALRKIFEATAAGCRVVTDLPAWDHLPAIDDNLIRVRPDITTAELRDVLQHAADTYDLGRQACFSAFALSRYDWRRETARVADALDQRKAAL
jgi:hypothetical protein